MKRFDQLQGLERHRPRPRLSSEVVTPLLIAAGLIGVPLAIGLASRANDDEAPPPAPTVDANTAYPMNHFLPGAGYYHAPYHTWFPVPFNFYDTGRGWYRGGQWYSTAEENAAERDAVARTSGFTARSGSSGYATRLLTSRPDPAAVQRANASAAAHHSAHVIRSGFGQSSRPGIS